MKALSDIERLIALEDIKLLKGRRDRAFDTRDWDTYKALHAPDHHSFNEPYEPWRTREEMMENVLKIMRSPDVATYHHSHTPEISFDSPGKASGIWGMEGYSFWKQGDEDHWRGGAGHYFETYEKRDGEWLFTSRRLKYVFRRNSPGAVYPTS